MRAFFVRGRTYLALEKLSPRGAYRVFDRHAGPDGDYRALHQIPASDMTRQRRETLRRVSGPRASRNFPGIIDFVRQGDQYTVVLAWVHGTNLRRFLHGLRDGSVPRPSAPEVVRLVRGLIHGVSHYHRKTHLVHGDLCPANLVLTSGTSQLVVIDFGSAWPLEFSARRERIDFTRPYAAPERLAQHAAEDWRSDQFSLSAIAYELFTLAVPYEGLGGQAGTPDWADLAAEAYIPPSRLIPSRQRLPVQALRLLDACLGTGLQPHPDQRFATSTEWLATWDALHHRLRKGSRLSRAEQALVWGIERIHRVFARRNR